MTTLKELILSAEDIPSEDVEIPEWGGIKVRVKGLTSEQIDQYQAKQIAMRRADNQNNTELHMRNYRAELVAQVLYDPDTDQRIFRDVKEGVRALSKKSSGVVNGLYVLAQELSGLDKEFGKKVEEAKEDFDDGQSSQPNTTWP